MISVSAYQHFSGPPHLCMAHRHFFLCSPACLVLTNDFLLTNNFFIVDQHFEWRWRSVAVTHLRFFCAHRHSSGVPSPLLVHRNFLLAHQLFCVVEQTRLLDPSTLSRTLAQDTLLVLVGVTGHKASVSAQTLQFQFVASPNLFRLALVPLPLVAHQKLEN